MADRTLLKKWKPTNRRMTLTVTIGPVQGHCGQVPKTSNHINWTHHTLKLLAAN